LDDWSDLQPSAMKVPIQIKRIEQGELAYLLCVSPARAEKDRAIRKRQEKRLLKDLEKLGERVRQALEKGHPLSGTERFERIGRLRERYPQAARYYAMEHQEDLLVWPVKEPQRTRAAQLDGAYFLKTWRMDLAAEGIWRTYMVLTRVEAAFRDLKGTLDMRPIYHRKETRVETHIFLCVLAYHLQAAIEPLLQQAGDHTNWETLREELSTHHVATVVMPTADGRKTATRRRSIPEQRPREIYRLLGIPGDPMKPIRTWFPAP
jgi:transposase